jgi:hypothetical protein
MNTDPKSSRTQRKAEVEGENEECEGKSRKIYGQGGSSFQEITLSGCECGGGSSLVVCSYSVNPSSYPASPRVPIAMRKILDDFGQTDLLLGCEVSRSRKTTNISNVSSKRRIANEIVVHHLDKQNSFLQILLYIDVCICIACHHMSIKRKNEYCVPQRYPGTKLQAYRLFGSWFGGSAPETRQVEEWCEMLLNKLAQTHNILFKSCAPRIVQQTSRAVG